MGKTKFAANQSLYQTAYVGELDAERAVQHPVELREADLIRSHMIPWHFRVRSASSTRTTTCNTDESASAAAGANALPQARREPYD